MPSETVNIKVAGCIRPLSETENAKGAKKILRASGKNVLVEAANKEQGFTMDYAYGPDVKAKEISVDCCEGILQHAFLGYNVTIMAFGSAGSGKTHLMAGNSDNPGIIQLVIKQFYQQIHNNKGKEFLVTASFLEVMDDEMTDMLNPHSNDMKIREHSKLGIYIDGLSELVVKTEDELLQVYDQGSRARKMGSNDLRAHRTRSAGIFTIHCYQRENILSKVGLRAKIHLVDLAGVQVAGDKSTNAVCNVIKALKEGGAVPYREHKLTRVLQDSLGGNSSTLVLACVSPADNAYQESLNTLQNTQLLRGIKNKMKVNLDETGDAVSHLRDEIARLRSKIMKNPEDKESVVKLQETVQDLMIAKQQSWDEKERLSSRYEEERKTNLANKGLLEWVLDTTKSNTKQMQEQIVMLQKEKDQLTLEYRNKKQAVDELKEQLQKHINEYSKLAESKKVKESDTKSKVATITELKDRLRKESEALKEVKRELKNVQEKQRKEKEATQGVTILKGNSELNYMARKEERSRVEAENKTVITEETERTRMERENDKADIQVKVKQGYTYSTEDAAKLDLELVNLKYDVNIMSLQIQCLQQEKELLESDLEDMYKRQKDELEIQQLQHFQTFREYREVFEQQKAVLEQRYRGLLEDAIQDAIFLSSRNNELLNENNALQKEIAEMKDKVVGLEAKNKKK